MDTREAVRDMLARGMSQRAISRELGLNRKTIYDHVQHIKALDANPGIQDALDQTGLSLDQARFGYRKVKDPETGSFNTVMWKAPEADLAQDFLVQAKEAFADLKPLPGILPPQTTNADQLTLYPIADAHIGMMAWAKETGEAYDTDKACERLVSWVGKCVDKAPPSETAIVLDVGDLMHADDQTNQTPRSKHQLDTDTRFYRTVTATIAAMSAAIEYAAQKHRRVLVRIIPGNHNPHSYVAILLALKERYRDSPQIHVQDDPSEFFLHAFGNVLIAAHHGDKAKADRMVMFLADQYPAEWGATRHRFLWTGHLHHHKSADIGGVQWEQLRALTARDAYAVSHAYCARAQLQAITYHREHGEVERVKVGNL